jgi:hypothetical protein
VFAMSPFGYGHNPVGTAAPGNLVVAGAELLAPDGVATTATKMNEITGAHSLAPDHQRHVTVPPFSGRLPV